MASIIIINCKLKEKEEFKIGFCIFSSKSTDQTVEVQCKVTFCYKILNLSTFDHKVMFH